MMRKILIVEDNKLDRALLNCIVSKEYDVYEASDGVEALNFLGKMHKVISAVLLDIFMPEMDGFEVLRAMRSNAVLSQIPVIISTGSQDEETEVTALSYGANDYVTKPYNPTLILHSLRNTINLRENASIINAIQKDKLTGLYNREAFFDKASTIVASGESGSYIMIAFDIDNFKIVNDQYGSDEGDRILIHIGKTLKEDSDRLNGLCARITSDNFAILISNSESSLNYVNEIREARFIPHDTNAAIMFSIGYYVITDSSISASAIYDRAYIAKRSVKGRYDKHIAFFSDSMRDKLIREQGIISEMDSAIALNQFEAWFQPQFNHSTKALIGAEALARWKHPERGMVPPSEFIPVFEENGFIYELDKYIWEYVCKYLHKWITEGLDPLPVSVNISRYDVFRADLIDVIIGLTEKYEVPVELLRLEITESAFSKSTKQIIDVVKRLMEKGFTVEIDDFGNGYSSLNTLKDVPANVLKLDMRFLENENNSQRGGNILESIVRMAKWLNMSVIAEGVEIVEQADFLKSIGCSYIQGYFYSRPVPAAEYEKLMGNVEKEQRLLSLETVRNLDNNTFWDPKSMDTLIFNSLIGGACIFEYHNGSIELLRVNDRYLQVIGASGISVEDVLKIKWSDHTDSDNARRIDLAVRESIETGLDVTEELEFVNMPGVNERLYLRATMRVISSSGDSHLVYCTNENMTAQRLAEMGEKEIAVQLQVIMDNISGGVIMTKITDDGVKLMYANDMYFELFGWTREGFTSQTQAGVETVCDEDKEWVFKALSDGIESDEPVLIEYRARKRSGKEIWLRRRTVNAALPGEPKPVQMSVLYDVTDEKRLARENADTEGKLFAIIDNVNGGVSAATSDNGKIRYLFTNDEYYRMFGYTKAQFEEELENGLIDIVNPADRDLVCEMAKRCADTGKPVYCEYRVTRRDGNEIWVRSSGSVCRIDGEDLPVHIAVSVDVTNIRETEEQLRFLNSTAHDLLAQPDTDKAIDGVLSKLRAYFGGRRAYIYELDADKHIVKNTYEVCAEGITSRKADRQSLPYDYCSYWMDAFKKEELVDIPDVQKIKGDSEGEWTSLAGTTLLSLIAVPIRRDGALIGMIGIDNPTLQRSNASRMVALGDYIAVMLTRRDLEAQIYKDNKLFSEFMNDTPGGFVRMRRNEAGKFVPVYFNNGFYNLTGMDEGALMALYKDDAMAGVHPDDVQIVNDFIDRALNDGIATSEKYRLINGEGKYIWLMVFGRITTDDKGNIILSVYYTDASFQSKVEEERAELLDNLPYGAALYDYDGEDLTVIHLNKRFRDMITRNIAELPHISKYNSVHPDDICIIMRELNAAIREQRDFAAEIRMMNSSRGDYQMYRVAGNIVPKEDGIYSVYAAFTPIADEELMYQEMLPLALSAVIGSSNDLKFVKDRNYRYVACNLAFAKAVGLNSEAEVVGKTDYELPDLSLADRYEQGEKDIVEGGLSRLYFEESLVQKDGSIRYTSTSKHPLMDSRGNVIGIFTVVRDITRTHELDSQLRLLTNSIPGGLATYLCSPSGVKMTYINDGLAQMFGYTHDEYMSLCEESPFVILSDDDRFALMELIGKLLDGQDSAERVCRARAKNGEFKWVTYKAAVSQRLGESITINAVMIDVTELRESVEKLRVSEEENRLAIEHSGNIIARFNILDRTLNVTGESAKRRNLAPVIRDIPEGPVSLGLVFRDSAEIFTSFFNSILNGAPSATATYQWKFGDGWRWLEAHAATIFGNDGKPVSAVVSFLDVTDRQEKEAVYKRWQQSLEDKSPNSYRLFRCNLSKEASDFTVEGSLFETAFSAELLTFNERTREYVYDSVYSEDRDRYLALVNSDGLLANYYRGKRSHTLDFREVMPNDALRWLRLTIDLVEYPNSKDIEAYLMYEDIDDDKRAELIRIERSETDPLTGTLNRSTFAARMEEIMAEKPESKHALMMLDIDGFKLVNDTFGHNAGDQTLIEISEKMRSMLRKDDLLSRFGGDEYAVFLADIPSDDIAQKKARQICAVVKKAYSLDVQISGSMGISIYPRDGINFDMLYKNADIALYHVKDGGRNNSEFYHEGMEEETFDVAQLQIMPAHADKHRKKRRMLIVDDNNMDFAYMNHLFADSFIVEKARDGNSALIRLRHYGNAISVVLLDLMMPGMDGFAVLDKMRVNPELRAIPVVVVSSSDDEMTALKAIRSGASDYVIKPFNPELLLTRVQSAVSKAENERLRAQNSFLELESGEIDKYRFILRCSGVLLIEYDWIKGIFLYDPSMSEYIAGKWDERSMWYILMSDMVCDVQTVRVMQEMVHDIAEDRRSSGGTMTVELKSPTKIKRRFKMNVYKRANEYKLTSNLLITLTLLSAND